MRNGRPKLARLAQVSIGQHGQMWSGDRFDLTVQQMLLHRLHDFIQLARFQADSLQAVAVFLTRKCGNPPIAVFDLYR